ncbi:ATP-binding protein [Cellvibrio mixtus]|uniref:ATP-binding protein n=1 Tax=Cellvibrio mixtus TaxID=39650 RepID=UPI000587628E|nr:ATP-binding protein [Cellvibrio mixtus]
MRSIRQDQAGTVSGDISQRTRWLKLASLALPIVLFIFMVSALELAIKGNHNQLRNQQLQQLGKDIADLSRLLEQELNASIYLVNGLQAYVESKSGNLRAEEIAPWLTNLQARGRHIRNIGIAPDNRIAYMFPLTGNEKAVGLYYPDNPKQWPDIEKVIQTRRANLVGPLALEQGGNGLIYRSPVFLENDHYWGIISVVINADTLFKRLFTYADEHSLVLNISDPDSGKIVLASNAVMGAIQTRQIMEVPGHRWEITGAVAPLPMNSTLISLRIGGWLVALLTTILLARFLRSIKAHAQTLLALREHQERFARMFTTSPQGLALLDDEGHWIEINTSFCLMLGYTAADIHQARLIDLFTPEARVQLLNHMQDIRNDYVSHTDHSRQFEARLIRSDGQWLTSFITLGICYRSNEETHWLLQMLDISERTRLDQLKNEFVSIVSHELRTPLTAIMGSLKLMASGKLEHHGGTEKILQIAVQNSEKLARLINDLLDMDKLIAGKMEFDSTIQPLLPLIEKALESNQYYAQQYQVSYRLQVPSTSPLVNVDALRLQQVLTNLLSNAAKFSPPHSEILISLLLEADRVQVTIQDQGTGIAKDQQHKLFKKFSQIDSSSTRQKGGTGLGLAISKELIERMGGSIGVNSSPGQGSCFYFSLPRVVVEEGEFPAPNIRKG